MYVFMYQINKKEIYGLQIYLVACTSEEFPLDSVCLELDLRMLSKFVLSARYEGKLQGIYLVYDEEKVCFAFRHFFNRYAIFHFRFIDFIF